MQNIPDCFYNLCFISRTKQSFWYLVVILEKLQISVIPNLVPEFGKEKKILNRECKTEISHIFSKSKIGTAIRGNDFGNLNCIPQNKDIENII